MQVNNNSNVLLSQVHIDQLQSTVEKLATSSELAPLLAGKGVTITDAPMDLEKLVAQLRDESDEAKATSNKDKLASIYGMVIARALENTNLSEANMAVLQKAQPYQNQLRDTNKLINGYEDENGNHVSGLTEKIAGAKKVVEAAQSAVVSAQHAVDAAQLAYDTATQAVTAAQGNVNQLQAQLLDLQNELAAATSEADKSAIQMKITATQGQLTNALATLSDAQKVQSTAAGKLTEATAALTTANSNLATANSAYSDLSSALTAANAQKAELTQQISNTLAELQNDDSLRELLDNLRAAVDELNLNTDIAEAERGKEEEEYLDQNNPVRIIQDAIAHQDLDFLDAVESKRENRI